MPAHSEIRFRVGNATYAVSDDALKTEHELLVIGLRPQQRHALEIRSTTSRGRTATRTVHFRARRPPDPVAEFKVTEHVDGGPHPGWTLVDLQQPGEPPTVAMYDLEGFPVWYHQLERLETLGVLDASLTWRQTVLIGGAVPTGARPVEVDLSGEVLWEGTLQVGYDFDGFQHHHLELLSNGNYLGIEKVFRDGTRGDVAYERTPAGERVWEWNTFDWLVPDGTPDWTHMNWARADGDLAWVNLAGTGQIVQIDRGTGEPDWILGRGGDVARPSDHAWFAGQHAPVFTAPNRVLVYDNKGLGDHSRLVEYDLTDGGLAQPVWEYGPEQHAWYAPAYGSTQVLPNGNLLVSAGAGDAKHLFELDPDDRIIWRMNTRDTRVYRARRIDPPLVRNLR